jgi:endonuclease/exonuclease/phosphatase family metal-dependent hydrolase
MLNNYAELRGLKRRDATAAERCAVRLLAMRRELAPLRKRKSDGTLLLATWNIRDFDSNKFGYGPRRPETFFYIAEIVSCFDLVAVQEVNRDLSALEEVMTILGPEWDYIATDPTEGTGGNQERMAFVYNKEKVRFRKIAGEVVLPDGQLVVSRRKKKKAAAAELAEASGDTARAAMIEAVPDTAPNAVEMAIDSGFEEVSQQFARTPFVAAFQSSWFKFNLCTVHIYFGAESGDKLKRRIGEIERLVEFFADRQDDENTQVKDPQRSENYILLGDFNVVSPEHQTMQALKRRGFTVPEAIDGGKVRKEDEAGHYYDQIAVRVDDPRFKVATGGMVDIYATVFRDTPEDLAIYQEHLPEHDPETDERFQAKTPRDLYLKWRTWQMSDHSPLWIEIETDFADHYLEGFAGSSD